MGNFKDKLLGSCDFYDNCSQVVYAVFRAFVGFGLAYGHGLGKVPPSDGFVGLVGGIGLPAPEIFAWMAALGELAGGILIFLGLFTRPAAMIAGVTMLVAWYTHAFGPLSADKGDFTGQEKALLYLVSLAIITAVGAGKFGIDSFFSKKAKS